MSARSVDCLMRSCSDLQTALQKIAPAHPLNQFNTKGRTVAEWEAITARFYHRFIFTKKPWRKLNQGQCYLAWFNFQNELEATLTIAKANNHFNTHQPSDNSRS
jgi:hypothetical protein